MSMRTVSTTALCNMSDHGGHTLRYNSADPQNNPDISAWEKLHTRRH